MCEYLIGAGALLTAGSESSIARAALHAQTDPQLAASIEAAVIDFEAVHLEELSRIVIVAAGWSSCRFETEIIRSLLTRRECTLAGVVSVLARAMKIAEVHLFARWLPDAAMLDELAQASVRLVVHPIESIDRAALISGQCVERWQTLFRAA